MTRRFLLLSLAAGLLTVSLGGLNAQASSVPLPTQLDQLVPPAGTGNSVSVGNLVFSDFTYSTSPVGSPPVAADIAVRGFTAGIENGLTFSGAFFANANTVVDYAITYVVTAPAGLTIFDATLSGTFNIFGNGTGTASVGETLFAPGNSNQVIGTLGISNSSLPDSASDTINFAGLQSIIVHKDILLNGGTDGIGISIINQGFSSVPEPTSMALLGIGLSGLVAFRRFRRRISVA